MHFAKIATKRLPWLCHTNLVTATTYMIYRGKRIDFYHNVFNVIRLMCEFIYSGTTISILLLFVHYPIHLLPLFIIWIPRLSSRYRFVVFSTIFTTNSFSLFSTIVVHNLSSKCQRKILLCWHISCSILNNWSEHAHM